MRPRAGVCHDIFADYVFDISMIQHVPLAISYQDGAIEDKEATSPRRSFRFCMKWTIMGFTEQ